MGAAQGGSARWLRTVQWTAGVAGALLVAVWVVAWVHGNALSRRDVARFEAARTAHAHVKVVPLAQPEKASQPPVDTSLWSTGRIEGFQESLDHDFGLPLAVLRIPVIDVVVPVLPGTDDLTLNRGAGWIAGTAEVGSSGNIGIAGHRDGFFRRFKDLQIGAEIVVETLDGSQTYVVEDMTIVEPSNVSVLAPTEIPTLTLVTCYPFYFVGSAPQRFIVRAVPRPEALSGGTEGKRVETRSERSGIESET